MGCDSVVPSWPGGRHVLPAEEIRLTPLPADRREPPRGRSRRPARQRHRRSRRGIGRDGRLGVAVGLRRALLGPSHAPVVEELAATGALASLLASGARFWDQVMLLSASDATPTEPRLPARRIAAPLLFGRLWEETGCRAVLEQVVTGRAFEVAVERAVFTAVLHRLMISGSDRACEKWMADYAIPGLDGLQLHHFYRTMAWLGEELANQTDRTALARRTVKDRI